MPFNGSGAFVPLSRPTYPPNDGELIQASFFKAVIDDLIGGLNSCLTRDGVGGPSNNLAMGGKKHTGASAAGGAGEYITWGQAATLAALTVQGTLTATGAIEGPQTSWSPHSAAGVGANYHVYRHADGTAIGYLGSDGGAVVSGGTGKGWGLRSREALYLMANEAADLVKLQNGELSFTNASTPYNRVKVFNANGLLELGFTTNAKVLSNKALYLQTPGGDFIIPEGDSPCSWQGHTVWTSKQFSPSEFALTGHTHAGVYQPVGSYAAASHDHAGVYQPVGSYAASSHNHDGTYATAGHLHTGVYQPAGSYASASHDHAGVYQPVGSYASASHSHDGTYARLDSGATFAGLVYGRGGGAGLGQITVSTAAPSGGANGDLWLVY